MGILQHALFSASFFILIFLSLIFQKPHFHTCQPVKIWFLCRLLTEGFPDTSGYISMSLPPLCFPEVFMYQALHYNYIWLILTPLLNQIRLHLQASVSCQGRPQLRVTISLLQSSPNRTAGGPSSPYHSCSSLRRKEEGSNALCVMDNNGS